MRRKLTAEQMLLQGNSAHLSKHELAARLKEELSTEVVVSAGRPRCPAHIKEDADALEAWKNAVKIMRTRGTLSRGDGELLEMYAVCKSRWTLACRDIKARGLEIEEERHAKDGTPYTVSVANPSLKVASDCEQRMLAYAKTLGLTPSDRTKIKRTRGSKREEQPKFVPEPGSMAEKFPHLFDAKGNPKCPKPN